MTHLEQRQDPHRAPCRCSAGNAGNGEGCRSVTAAIGRVSFIAPCSPAVAASPTQSTLVTRLGQRMSAVVPWVRPHQSRKVRVVRGEGRIAVGCVASSRQVMCAVAKKSDILGKRCSKDIAVDRFVTERAAKSGHFCSSMPRNGLSRLQVTR